MSNVKIDPILVAVIGNRFDAITKEIGETMLRTSRSPIFSEARDLATAVFDKDCRLIAQTAYIPVLMASMPFAIKSIDTAFQGDVHEGDVFILNDPYCGNNHPPDIVVAKPVFYKGELQFWAVSKGHHADVGGGGVAGYNPESTTVFQECLRIAPSRLYSQGVYQKDTWNFILSNVLLGFLVEGDLHCQVGACNIGERGIIGLLEKYGPETLYQALDEIFDASEREVRAQIGRMPEGTYSAERYIDHDGVNKDKMIKIAVDVIVKDDSITFDLSRSDAQVAGYVNSTLANSTSACYLALFTSFEGDVTFNEGALRAINAIAPEGLVVNARFPAPTTCCTISCATPIIEASWLALSQVIPQQVQACWARWCSPATIGFNPFTGRPFADIHFMSKGGGGATYGYDGWDHIGVVVCSGGLRSPDPELHELSSPYFVTQYEYWPDSAGAGQWRGGLGTIYKWRVDAPGIKAANFGGGVKDETAPYGLEGGKGAPKHILRLNKVNGEVIEVDAESFYAFDVGDVFEIYESGGGGFGHPYKRPVERVQLDVRNGVVSVYKAREDYGVVINPVSYEVDLEATRRIRG